MGRDVGQELHQTVERLRKEIHQAYLGTGRELSCEKIVDLLHDSLDRVLITYTQVELAKVCNLRVQMPEEENDG